VKSSLTELLLAVLAGAGLGVFYFGGLWWTLRRMQTAAHPGLLLTVSYAVRVGVMAGGLFLVSRGRWEQAAAAVAGMLLCRPLVSRMALRRDAAPPAAANEKDAEA
jgi:F1F0 ATPase subunit 2